jgi:hypothetical protein
MFINMLNSVELQPVPPLLPVSVNGPPCRPVSGDGTTAPAAVQRNFRKHQKIQKSPKSLSKHLFVYSKHNSKSGKKNLERWRFTKI